MLKFGNYEVEFVQNSLQLNPFNFNMERITFQVVSVKDCYSLRCVTALNLYII